MKRLVMVFTSYQCELLLEGWMGELVGDPAGRGGTLVPLGPGQSALQSSWPPAKGTCCIHFLH